MDIIYLGHSSFKITGKKASVITDPFDQEMLGLKFPKVDSDIVTVSHDHPDHNKIEAVSNVHKVISGPGEYETRGVSLLGFSSFHDNEKGASRGSNTIYVIEIDGSRLVHLGDLGHKLSESTISEIGSVDILFVPVGGEYTIGPKEACEVIKSIEPSIIIPMHYQLPGLKEEIFSKLKPVSEFVESLGLTPETTTKLSLKEGVPIEEQKLIILERK